MFYTVESVLPYWIPGPLFESTFLNDDSSSDWLEEKSLPTRALCFSLLQFACRAALKSRDKTLECADWQM